MGRDWSRGAFDDFVVDPRLSRAAGAAALATTKGTGGQAGTSPAKTAGVQAGMAAKCLLMGVMIALLYIWPGLMVANILSGGFRAALFASILAGSAGLASLGCWVAAELERRYWERNWDQVSEFADPEYWR